MLRISDARIEEFITEDVPYIDLTCEVLGIGDAPGEMDYFTREECVLAGTDVARRMASKLGCEAVSYTHLDVYKRQPARWPREGD